MLVIGTFSGTICVTCSFIFFLICRCLVRPLTAINPTPDNVENHEKRKGKYVRSTPFVHTCLTDSNVERCQRTNICISFLHAVITGSLAAYSFLAYGPDIYRDFINHICWLTFLTCSFSFGYFCYDFVDVISNRRGSDLWEMMLHHVLTLILLGTGVFQQRNVGYIMVALLAEVNSMFLHLRKLFQLFNIPRENSFVRLNMVINLITFIAFRLGILCFGTMSILHDGLRLGTYFYYFLIFILAPTMWIMNPVLFYRILNVDFLKKSKPTKLAS